jgi:hypothetical protein
MNDTARKIDVSTVVTGLLLIVVGGILLFADFHDVVRVWWPMVLVAIGVPRLFRRDTLWSGLWLVAIGAWFQAVRLHLFDLTFRNSWPLLLIIFGAGIALRAVFDAMASTEVKEERNGS